MGRFNQFLGKTELTVAGEALELDFKLHHQEKIMNLRQKENMMTGISGIIKEVIKTSYPQEPIQELEAFVDKNIMEFITELAIAFKWTTRKDVERAKEQIQKKLESQGN